ncbi:MAG: Rne/Rng family ribonuclease [Gammaproteobacteria bacterium]|nr:Rne/Rng family ribonuclease [Gammaproteobacteria bacterium]
MKMMLISVLKSREVRVAIVNSNGAQNAPVLHDLHIEKFANRSSQGNIYKAKVVSINDQLQAAFVDFGDLKHGLLTLDKLHYKYGRRGSSEENNTPERIADVLNVNDDVLVQVERDARVEKGAALTGQIQLHGQHVVLNTNRPITRISRQINREQRGEIEAMMPKLKVPNECGLVIRTSARGRSQKELQTDVRECADLLKLIQQAYSDSQAPRLLYEANNLVNSVLRDNLHSNIERVIVDDKGIYDDIRSFVKSYMADFSGEIQLYKDEIPLYTKYRIEAQVSKVFDRTIELPSGGQIVLDPTEALLTIDVNSAQFRFNDNFRDMVLNTNLEAAEEIFKQLRLRDIGGLIVVDFIDLYEVQDIRKLEDRVARLCDQDRGRTKWEPISSFGLMELQRRRPRSSIYDTDFQRCDGCGGHGYRQTVDSVGHRIFREIEARSHSKRIARIRARVTPAVAQYLTNELRPHLSMVEMRSSAKLEVVPDQDGEDASFVVESFSTTYSKTPVKTKNFEHGMPENGKGKKGKVNRETQAESIQTAAVKRPEVERKPPKKSEARSGKDKTGVSNVLEGATRFFRFVPAVPSYLYQRLFVVENESKGTTKSNQKTSNSRKRTQAGRTGSGARTTQRVKQKITRHSPNKTTARSSQSKRIKERTLPSSVPTTKSTSAQQEGVKSNAKRDSAKKATKSVTPKIGEVKKKSVKKSSGTKSAGTSTSKEKAKNKAHVAKKAAAADLKQKAIQTPGVEKRPVAKTDSKEEKSTRQKALKSPVGDSPSHTEPQTKTDNQRSPENQVVDRENVALTEGFLNEEENRTTQTPIESTEKKATTSDIETSMTEPLESATAESDQKSQNNDLDGSTNEATADVDVARMDNDSTDGKARASNDPRIQPKENRPIPVVSQ